MDKSIIKNREWRRLRPKKIDDAKAELDDDFFLFKMVCCFHKVIQQMKDTFNTSLDYSDLYILLLVKNYMVIEGRNSVTKGIMYNWAIKPYWRLSYPTFNSRFNRLVALHFFNSLGYRGRGNHGYSEEYVLTLKEKLIGKLMSDNLSNVN